MKREIDVQKIFFIDWLPVQAGYLKFIPDQRIFCPQYIPRGVKIVAEKPKLSPAWLKADTPWEDFTIGAYPTVTYEDGRYRLWYDSYDSSFYEKSGGDSSAKLCYAESPDGINWDKPKLGIVAHRGDKANNIVYNSDITKPYTCQGIGVFRDPVSSPEERYKMIYMDAPAVEKFPRATIRGATSPDGIHWKPIEKYLIDNYWSDTQTTCYYDTDLKCYVAYLRIWHQGRRGITRATSTDFREWQRPEIVLSSDGPHNHPSHDLYTNAHIKYSKDVHFMFPAQYNRETDTLAVHLAASRDGIRWHYFGEEPIIAPGEGTGSIYAGCGLVPLGEKSIALPYVVYPTTHNYLPMPAPYIGEYHWAIWERDRLVALCAHDRGEFSCMPTKPIQDHLEFGSLFGDSAESNLQTSVHHQNRLILNLRTEQVGEVYAQLSDEKENTIEGYSFDDCNPIRGDHFEIAVSWRGKTDIPKAITDKPIIISFRMYAARIYTFQLC